MKAFIFDMDGVLLDTESICDDTWIEAGKKHGITQKDAMIAIDRCRGMNKKNIIENLEEMFGKDFDAESYLMLTGELFHKIENEKGIKNLPYAEECLKVLKEKGYRLALASSTRKESVMRQLTNAGLIDYFEVIITGDMVKNSKPDPEIYKTACTCLGIESKLCYAVEDSPNGLMSAKNAGLTTIMVPDRIKPNEVTSKYSDFVFKNLKEVFEKF